MTKTTALKTAFLSLLLLSFSIYSSETWRIEAETLKGDAGWQIGVGKIHSMGKVQVALKKNIQISGVFQLPRPGIYQIWVKTNTLGQGWRIGELLINQQSAGIFGDDTVTPQRAKGSWYWKKLSSCHLAAGECTLQIKSPKSFARIDCIILSDDASFIPPENKEGTEKIQSLRQIR